ncbi:hypothetical protein LMG23992_04800 [Cupriavidus laharis]|uniref:Uncharacterized protein n=1 Tax=Cupriavidus laharis TaxID=151654 RepID=A0ABN7Z9R8_9BURK|nr:hypothetical protein [Cupriavidus laharis]CAG9182689.1 hypothetical protein LMG23992_04800 [Cupriavidus laharis]
MSKTVRTGGRADKRASAALRPQASTASARKRDEDRKRSAVKAAGGNVPSTLDPDLTESAQDIDAELAQVDRDRHGPPDEALPEEEINEEIERAAQRLPADVPVDKRRESS